MTTFHLLLYHHETVSIALCHQSRKCFRLYLIFCMLPVAIVTILKAITPIRAHNEEWVTFIAYNTTESANLYNFICIYMII